MAVVVEVSEKVRPVSDTAGPATVSFEPNGPGRTHARVRIGNVVVSRCEINRLLLRVGRAILPVDGIQDVWTEESYRRRGYARQLLEATVQRMRGGDAALSLLYGISDFYPKFGYATLGFDFSISLRGLDRSYPLPDGWQIRAFAPDDLPAIRQIYDRATAYAVGPVVRPSDTWVWKHLATLPDRKRPALAGKGDQGTPDECRVALAPSGEIAAYFWRGEGLNYVSLGEQYFPTSLAIGEVVAYTPVAADAILAACRAFAKEESTRLSGEGKPAYVAVQLGAQPDSAVAAAAQYEEAWSIAYSWDCGGPMVRLLDPTRLFVALKPELDERWRAAGLAFRGTLRLHTDLGSVVLDLTSAGISPGAATDALPDAQSVLDLALPQTALARLALGGFPPEDLLARLGISDAVWPARILAVLFPRRWPYLYMADRP